MQHDPLDSLLARRAKVPENPRLAERISRAALMRQQGEIAGQSVFQAIFGGLLPQPAFALAAVLVLGFVLGFGTQGGAQASDMQTLTDEETYL